MLTIDIITLLPELLESPLQHSILKRAQDKGLIKINIHQLRDYASGKHKQADDAAYGGGAGMVMMIEPIANCIDSLTDKTEYDEVIYLSPDGEQMNQNMANQLSLKKNLLILCGHYKGIDERVRELYITKEISIGDYVLSGGELPAVVVIDTVARLLPGVLNDESSALSDSFQDNMIAPPVYTRPAEFRGIKVPDVLLSGHEAKINEWRDEQSHKRTKERRPKLDR